MIITTMIVVVVVMVVAVAVVVMAIGMKPSCHSFWVNNTVHGILQTSTTHLPPQTLTCAFFGASLAFLLRTPCPTFDQCFCFLLKGNKVRFFETSDVVYLGLRCIRRGLSVWCNIV